MARMLFTLTLLFEEKITSWFFDGSEKWFKLVLCKNIIIGNLRQWIAAADVVGNWYHWLKMKKWLNFLRSSWISIETD